MYGDGAHGVKIRYRDGEQQKSVIIGIKGAAGIVAAIDRARTRVHIAPVVAEAADQEADDEADEARRAKKPSA